MIREIAVIFSAGKYTWFRWNAGKATTIYTKKGKEYYMSKGAKFGIRPATSKKGMYRVITQELGPSIIFSMDQNEVNKLTKNSVMAKVEAAALKTFTVRLFSRVIPGKFIKAYTMKAKDENEAKRIADEDYPMQTVEVTEHKNTTASTDKQILDFLTHNFMVKVELKDIKELRYIRVGPQKIQLVETWDADIGQLPYLIFVEGKKRTDLYAGVGGIGLTVATFIQWLQKHGAKEKPKQKQKRPRNFVLYD